MTYEATIARANKYVASEHYYASLGDLRREAKFAALAQREFAYAARIAASWVEAA